MFSLGQSAQEPTARLAQQPISTDEAAALFDQALSQDMSAGAIVQAAEPLVALGADLPTASIIVAVAGLAFKLLQMATPYSNAGAKWFDRKLNEEPPRETAKRSTADADA